MIGIGFAVVVVVIGVVSHPLILTLLIVIAVMVIASPLTIKTI
jgi:hypothetical protein